jgi:hypothetical protein
LHSEPSKKVKGDTLANIRAMVDVSIASTTHLSPKATKNVGFDTATQSFVDERGERIGNEQLSALLEEDGRSQGTGQAGDTTLRRSALFKSLLQSVGNRTKFVEQLHRQQNSGSKNPSGALAKTFYSRGQSSATGLTADHFTVELTKAFGAKVAERLQVNFRTHPQRIKKFSATFCAD